MVTPFNEDGALDVDASVTLAKWLVEQGSEGLVITGTTGEGPAVTDEEDWELWRAVAEAVTVPVIAGTTCLLYTSPSPRDGLLSRMPSSA